MFAKKNPVCCYITIYVHYTVRVFNSYNENLCFAPDLIDLTTLYWYIICLIIKTTALVKNNFISTLSSCPPANWNYKCFNVVTVSIAITLHVMPWFVLFALLSHVNVRLNLNIYSQWLEHDFRCSRLLLPEYQTHPALCNGTLFASTYNRLYTIIMATQDGGYWENTAVFLSHLYIEPKHCWWDNICLEFTC